MCFQEPNLVKHFECHKTRSQPFKTQKEKTETLNVQALSSPVSQAVPDYIWSHDSGRCGARVDLPLEDLARGLFCRA